MMACGNGGGADLVDGGVASDANTSDAWVPTNVDVCVAPGCPSGYADIGNDTCAASDDPRFGCAAAGGAPCQLANAHPECVGGACAIARCVEGWADCDNNPSNGCEANLSDPDTCGSCTTTCAQPQYCSAQGCVDTCSFPNQLCGRSCVNPATSVQHCGTCDNACSPNAYEVAECSAASCESTTCIPGSAECGDQGCLPTGLCGRDSCCGGLLGCTADPCSCPEGWELHAGVCRDVRRDTRYCGCAAGSSCSPCDDAELCWGGECVDQAPWIADLGGEPQDILHVGGRLYWSMGDSVWSVDASAESPTPEVFAESRVPKDLATDGQYLYWSDDVPGLIVRKALAGGDVETIASEAATGLSVDATHVYWIRGNFVVRAPKAGGTVETVFDGGFDWKSIAVGTTDPVLFIGLSYSDLGHYSGRMVVLDKTTLSEVPADSVPTLSVHVAGSQVFRITPGNAGTNCIEVGDVSSPNAPFKTLSCGLSVRRVIGGSSGDELVASGIDGPLRLDACRDGTTELLRKRLDKGVASTDTHVFTISGEALFRAPL